jgi:hypothetical protein
VVPLQAVDQSHQHKYGAALTEVQTIIAPVQIWMTVHAPTEFPAAVTHVPSTSTQELPKMMARADMMSGAAQIITL